MKSRAYCLCNWLILQVVIGLGLAGPASAETSMLDCSGERPIEGYDNQRMATVPLIGNDAEAPEERAVKRAQSELLDRMLGNNTCGRDELLSKIKPLRRGRNATAACAQVVLSNEDWDGFRAAHRQPALGWTAFRESIAKAGMPKVEEFWRKVANIGPTAHPRIAVMNYPGDRSLLELIGAQVRIGVPALIPWNDKWSVRTLPPSIDVVLVAQWQPPADGDLFVQIPIEARIRSKQHQPYASMTFATEKLSRCLLPAAPSDPPEGKIRLDLPTHPGGTACSGDRIGAEIVSTAAERQHVRVLDLWGDGDGAMLIWPRRAEQSDVVEPGERLPLLGPGQHFAAVAGSVPLERFLVASSSDMDALDRAIGTIRNLAGCRVSTDVAGDWHRVQRLRAPDIRVTVTELRVVAGGKCGTKVDVAERVRAEAELEGLPVCR